MNPEADMKARAIDLKSHIEYSSGSVVSKTIVEKKTGSLTPFSFDKGQGLSEHTSPYDAVVQILEGAAELVIGGQPISAAEGQLVIMPAQVPHSVRAVAPFKMMLIMIRSEG